MAFQLELSEKVSTGLKRLLLEEISNIQEQLTNPDIEREVGIHEARKSCKRIRAVLRLLRGNLEDAFFRRENTRFRDVARKLAAARDCWVKIESLDGLLSTHLDVLFEADFKGLRDQLIKDYDVTLSQQRNDKTLIPNIVSMLNEGVQRFMHMAVRNEGFNTMERGLRRTYARGRRGLVQSKANPTPKNLHEWRKRVKYLWHQVEILKGMQPEDLTLLAEELHNLADYLGDHHDLVVLSGEVREHRESFSDDTPLELLVDLINQQRLTLESKAISLGEQLYPLSKHAFTHQMRLYWQDWRMEI